MVPSLFYCLLLFEATIAGLVVQFNGRTHRRDVVPFRFWWLVFTEVEYHLSNNFQMKQKDRHKRPPLTIRCSEGETLLIDCAAVQLGTSRSALFRRSALSLVRQLQQEGLLATTDGAMALESAA